MLVEHRDNSPGADAADAEVERARSELQRRFASGGGCMARAADFACLFPALPARAVEEALHRLADEGGVEMLSLSDGTLAFRFTAA